MILHTADWHLWHKHKYTKLIPGKHWDAMFAAKMDVLEKTFCEFLAANTVKYFIIAGDVFDHHNPIEPVRKEFISLILKISKYVEGVYVLMGNHDQYKGQFALESISELLPNEDFNIRLFKNGFTVDGYYVDHMGVEGFEANGGYIEKDTIKVSELESMRVLLGHYHKCQIRKDEGHFIAYSGSPYPVDFGEEKEQKYFLTYDKGKCKRNPINRMKFITNPSLNEWEKGKYWVVRLKETCKLDKEKEKRKELLDRKLELMKDVSILDVIIDLKVEKGIQINKKNKGIGDYKQVIDKMEIEDKFKEYINKKFEEIEE